MKNLFIIGTPGHYFNLLECIEKFELKKENSDLLFLNSNSTCPDKLLDNFVDNYVNKNDWNRVIRISLWDIPSRKLFSFHNIRLIITFLIKITLFFCLRNYHTIVSNQVEQTYSKLIYFIVFYKRVISLDEGNAVFEIIENRNNNKHFNFFLPSKITFFSSYDINVISPDELVRCNYDFSKKTLKNCSINKKQVYFIGSPYLEDGLIEEDLYWQHIKNIKNYYSDYEIIYFNHRREISNNLNRLKNEFYFSIISLDVSIELYFLNIDQHPKIVSGFTTAALLNLRKMFPDNTIEIHSYYIDPDCIKFTSYLPEIYKQYSKNNIKIIKLDN